MEIEIESNTTNTNQNNNEDVWKFLDISTSKYQNIITNDNIIFDYETYENDYSYQNKKRKSEVYNKYLHDSNQDRKLFKFI